MEAIINPRENQPINVSAETKEVADVFMTTIGEMFETIEMLAGAERPMNEGEWLVLAKQFQKLATMKARTVTTVVYVEQERTHRRGRVLAKKSLTRAEKLANEDFMSCPKCKKVITKRHYAEKHSKSGICKHVVAVENIASHNKAEVKKDDGARRVKISNNTIFAKETVVSNKMRRGVFVEQISYVIERNTPSIAHRSFILEEIFKQPQCDAHSGMVSINKINHDEESDSDEEEIDEDDEGEYMNARRLQRRLWALRKVPIVFQQFNPNEIGKYTQDEETGKWVLDVPVAVEKPKTVRIKLKVKQPKKKLVVVEDEGRSADA